MIRIDNKFGLQIDERVKRVFESAENKAYICGELYGYVDKDITLSASKAMNRLKKLLEHGEDIISFLRWCVGGFFILLIENDQIKIYVSPKGPGFYYYVEDEHFVITTDELGMARACIKNGLNEMELMHLLCASILQACTPFTTLFNGAKRLPGGTSAILDKKFTLKSDMYIADLSLSFGESDEKNYKIFKRIFEDTCKLVCNRYKPDNIKLFLSAGIDSSALLAACMKTEPNLTPMHWMKSNHLTNAINILCEKLGTSAQFIGKNYGKFDANKLNYESSKKLYTKSLGIIGIGNMYVSQIDNPGMYLTGIGYGCIIQTNAFMRANFGESILKRIWRDTKLKKPMRYFFTEGYFKMVKKGIAQKYNNAVSFITGDKALSSPKDIADYLFCLSMANKLPFSDSISIPSELFDLKGEYRNYIENEIFKVILGQARYDEIRNSNGNTLLFDDVRRLSRLIRYAVQVQRASKNDLGYQKDNGFILEAVPLEGPIVSYFFNQSLTLKDVFKPKRYLFKYFKEEVGVSYNSFLNKIWIQTLKRPGKEYFEAILRRIGLREKKQRPVNLLIESQIFKEQFLPTLDPENSTLISLIKNLSIRDYVYDLYTKCITGEEKDVKRINLLLNLELFLRNVYSPDTYCD